MADRRILLATRSAGKLRELEGILSDAGFTAVTLDDAGIAESDAEAGIECFDNFEDNALAKARYFHELSGMPALADDSGLCVDALGGAPGVRSKRYCGRDDLRGQDLDDANNRKLLAELDESSDASARYCCAAAFVRGDTEEVVVGETAGAIVRDSRGESGFGYDPYFFSSDLGKTFGEARTDEKQGVSHRGRAFRLLLAALRARGEVI